jgi:hypothetical protein
VNDLFLLDSNCFIQPKKLFYRRNVHTGFWHWLEKQLSSGRCMSVIPVLAELNDQDDWLKHWANNLEDFFYECDDESTQKAHKEIAQFVATLNVAPREKSRFLSGADPDLIAKATTLENCIVVTQEKKHSGGNKRIKIPDVCEELFNIQPIDLFDLQEKLGATFPWEDV